MGGVYRGGMEKVIFIHVKAHTGLNDEISLSNNIADKLAHEGALRGLKKIENLT